MGDFRLKFFELGTQERHTKSAKSSAGYRRGKGRRTGRIKPLYFFKRAKNTTEPIIFNNINRRISESIYKIYSRK